MTVFRKESEVDDERFVSFENIKFSSKCAYILNNTNDIAPVRQAATTAVQQLIADFATCKRDLEMIVHVSVSNAAHSKNVFAASAEQAMTMSDMQHSMHCHT